MNIRLNNSPFFATKRNQSSEGTEGHKLLIQAGFIDMLGSGLYTWLPLGLRVLNKIQRIIRRELDQAGCQELLFPTIHPGALWEESGRLTGAYIGEKLTIKDRANKTLVYGPTAEEPATDLFRKHIQSYKQLPLVIYNIQWKFRDEIRPRFGVKRAREFLMLDAYSFGSDVAQEQETYKYMVQIFQKALQNCGVSAISAQADPGEIGGSLSHELIVEGKNGEAELGFLDDGSAIMLEGKENSAVVKKVHGTEVGHTFYLSDTYSTKMKANIAIHSGGVSSVQMGCYGIGVSRLLGVIAEDFARDGKLNWPVSKSAAIAGTLAPYDVVLIPMMETDVVNELCVQLERAGYDVLIDNRNVSMGERLSDAELVGIPFRVVIGKIEIAERVVEIKSNSTSAKVAIEDCVVKVRELIGGM